VGEGRTRWSACWPADCCRSDETVLGSFTTVVECSVMECATRSVVSRRVWRRATVRSLEAEKGCKLEVAMSSGKVVACNADSTVCGTSDVISVMMSLQERGSVEPGGALIQSLRLESHNQRLYSYTIDSFLCKNVHEH
jgi:hypothetical protein